MREIPNPATDPIRQAVASGQFQLAERLWNGYMTRLKEEMRRGSLAAASLEEAHELLEWSRVTVLCMRAHAQSQLGNLHIAGAYVDAPPSVSSRIIQTSL
ncbi:MAG TPA: hypothetical protein VG096_03140 [Bryobacteraceae bacterium]|jgi:hypothetical protein|nr:hypothetical protein [Bryobacteraceae bacterium]